MAAIIGGDERVRAAAQQIVKRLGKSKNVKDDMILILSSFDNRLSTMTDLLSPGDGGGEAPGGGAKRTRAEETLDASEKVIFRWGSASSGPLHSEESHADVAEYLDAVDGIISLTEDQGAPLKGEILDRAETALQIAMSRLEEEFRGVIIRNTVPLDADSLTSSINSLSLSFKSDSGTETLEEFERSSEDELEPQLMDRSRSSLGGGGLSENFNADLFRPEAVYELKEIADRMIRSKYEKECSQVYSSIRRETLDECLAILGVHKMSIDEVQRMEWRVLDDEMKKWSQGVRVFIRVLLPREKQVCEQIFSSSELIGDSCFTETTKACLLRLLNFGEAIAIGRRSSERLFRILDMFDALADVMPDLHALLPEDSKEFIAGEAEAILRGLGDAAKGSFSEFVNQIQRESSRKLMLGCQIHPLTRHVMNYVTLLVDYSASLNALFADESSEINDGDDESDEDLSPFGRRLHSLISYLETNLVEKSKLYEDGAMQYIFLMNNILYVLQKVKESKLRTLIGDHWVRKRLGQIRQYSMIYLRNSWGIALSCLKDEGIGCTKSSANVSKVVKERFRNFNQAFEEIYRIQTAWKVPDPQLREELRISVSEKVIAAYRSFMGRFAFHLEGGRHGSNKHIKYSPEDLENRLLELFEGKD